MLLLAACSEYDFAGSGGPDPELDAAVTAPTPGQAEDTEDIDSGAADVPRDTGTPIDACYEPEDGYAQNPAARLVSTEGTAHVLVTFLGSDTAYQDTLWLDAPSSVRLARAWEAAPGTTIDLGAFSPGTELVFGIEVTNTGDHWKSGPAVRNADGVAHVAPAYEGNCSWWVGFEDLYGGGDLDFNDVVMRVQGMLKQEE